MKSINENGKRVSYKKTDSKLNNNIAVRQKNYQNTIDPEVSLETSTVYLYLSPWIWFEIEKSQQTLKLSNITSKIYKLNILDISINTDQNLIYLLHYKNTNTSLTFTKSPDYLQLNIVKFTTSHVIINEQEFELDIVYKEQLVESSNFNPFVEKEKGQYNEYRIYNYENIILLKDQSSIRKWHLVEKDVYNHKRLSISSKIYNYYQNNVDYEENKNSFKLFKDEFELNLEIISTLTFIDQNTVIICTKNKDIWFLEMINICNDNPETKDQCNQIIIDKEATSIKFDNIYKILCYVDENNRFYIQDLTEIQENTLNKHELTYHHIKSINDFLDPSEPNANLNLNDPEFNSILIEFKNVQHQQFAEQWSKDFLVLAIQSYNFYKFEKFIQITLVLIDRLNAKIVKNFTMVHDRVFCSTFSKNFAFAFNMDFQDPQQHMVNYQPGQNKKADKANTLIHPLLRIDESEHNSVDLHHKCKKDLINNKIKNGIGQFSYQTYGDTITCFQIDRFSKIQLLWSEKISCTSSLNNVRKIDFEISEQCDRLVVFQSDDGQNSNEEESKMESQNISEEDQESPSSNSSVESASFIDNEEKKRISIRKSLKFDINVSKEKLPEKDYFKVKGDIYMLSESGRIIKTYCYRKSDSKSVPIFHQDYQISKHLNSGEDANIVISQGLSNSIKEQEKDQQLNYTVQFDKLGLFLTICYEFYENNPNNPNLNHGKSIINVYCCEKSGMINPNYIPYKPIDKEEEIVVAARLYQVFPKSVTRKYFSQICQYKLDRMNNLRQLVGNHNGEYDDDLNEQNIRYKNVLMIQTMFSITIFAVNEQGACISNVPLFYIKYDNEVINQVELHPITNQFAVLSKENHRIQQIDFNQDVETIEVNKEKLEKIGKLKIELNTMITTVSINSLQSNILMMTHFGTNLGERFEPIQDFKKSQNRYDSVEEKEEDVLVIFEEEQKLDLSELNQEYFIFSNDGRQLIFFTEGKMQEQPLKEDCSFINRDRYTQVFLKKENKKADTALIAIGNSTMNQLCFISIDGRLRVARTVEEPRVQVDSGFGGGVEISADRVGLIDEIMIKTSGKTLNMNLDRGHKFMVVTTDWNFPQLQGVLQSGLICNSNPVEAFDPEVISETIKTNRRQSEAQLKQGNFNMNNPLMQKKIKNMILMKTRKETLKKKGIKDLDKEEQDNEQARVKAVEFHPYLKQLAIGQEEWIIIQSQDTHSGRMKEIMVEHSISDSCSTLKFSSCGKFITVGYESGKAEIYYQNFLAIDDKKIKQKSELLFKLNDISHNSRLSSFCFSVCKEYLLITWDVQYEIQMVEKSSLVETDKFIAKNANNFHRATKPAPLRQEIMTRNNIEVKGKINYKILKTDFSPDSKLMIIACEQCYVHIQLLIENICSLIETIARQDRRIKSFDIHQASEDSIKHQLLIADNLEVTLWQLDEGKNVYNTPIVSIQFGKPLLYAKFFNHGDCMAVSFMNDMQNYECCLRTQYVKQLILQQGSEQALESKLDDFSLVINNSYKILKLFITEDKYEVIKTLTYSYQIDFYQIDSSSPFQLALKFKNVNVLKIFLDNFANYDDQGLLEMLSEAIIFIIEKNNGSGDEPRDEYIMNFVRSYISTTKFRAIDNINAQVCDIIKRTFKSKDFKDNNVWLNCGQKDIISSNVKTCSYQFPILYMSKIQILQVINEDERVETFGNQGIMTTIELIWDRMFYKIFVPQLVMYLLKFFTNISIAISLSTGSIGSLIFMASISSFLAILTLIYELQEWQVKGLQEQMNDFWNQIELSNCIGEIVSCMIVLGTETIDNIPVNNFLRQLSSIILFLNLINLMKILRGFDDQSWLVKCFIQNFEDIKSFIVLVGVFVIYFSTMFMQLFIPVPILDNTDTCLNTPKLYAFLNDSGVASRVDQQSGFYKSLVSTFNLIFGAFDFGFFDETINKTQSFLLFIMIVLMLVIIMLNTLIAILGDSQAGVKENSEAQVYKQKLNIICDQFDVLPHQMQQIIEESVMVIKLLAPKGAFSEDQREGGFQGGDQFKTLKRDTLDKIRTTENYNRDLFSHRVNKIESKMFNIENHVSNLLLNINNIKSDINTKRMNKMRQNLSKNLMSGMKAKFDKTKQEDKKKKMRI